MHYVGRKKKEMEKAGTWFLFEVEKRSDFLTDFVFFTFYRDERERGDWMLIAKKHLRKMNESLEKGLMQKFGHENEKNALLKWMKLLYWVVNEKIFSYFV